MDIVYLESKYIENLIIKQLYFPSKMILFKMMKACIGVQEIE